MKRRKKRVKQILDFTKAGVTMGVGSQVLQGIGTTPATRASEGIGQMSRFAPVMGTVVGARWVMDELGNLHKTVKRKKRKRR